MRVSGSCRLSSSFSTKSQWQRASFSMVPRKLPGWGSHWTDLSHAPRRELITVAREGAIGSGLGHGCRKPALGIMLSSASILRGESHPEENVLQSLCLEMGRLLPSACLQRFAFLFPSFPLFTTCSSHSPSITYNTPLLLVLTTCHCFTSVCACVCICVSPSGPRSCSQSLFFHWGDHLLSDEIDQSFFRNETCGDCCGWR